ncbi:MAG TPA: hypothetical protein VFG30_08805 [Polyangiales bacterium]|nr:hypothetical protein [Polyangiales bacterium]
MSGDGQLKSPVLERGLYRWLRTWLSHPAADQVIMWLGFVLLLPSLSTGLAADDYVHTAMLDKPPPIEGFARAPLDIFRFCDPKFSPLLIREGIFPWWDDPEARLAFMRPITAATHVLDHELWRNVGWAMHLHSALWGLLLLAGVRALYREWIDDRFLGTLAFALYALDDARGWLVSWVAARNAAVGTAISIWALVVHVRERRGQLPLGKWLAPVLLGLGLLGSEGAAAIGCYVLGHTLFMERGPLLRRVLRLWPYAIVVVLWRVAYVSFDYGVIGSGVYVDPLREPLRFAKMFLENAPILLGSQFGGMWSDTSVMLFILPRLKIVIYLASVLFAGAVIVALIPGLRRSPLLRCCAFGASVSLIPASPTFVADRLLTWVAIGACVLLASLIAPVLQRISPAPPAVGSSAASTSVWSMRLGTLLLFLFLVGIVFLPGRSRGTLLMRDFIDRAGAGIPSDPSIASKTLVFVNPPHLPFASYPAIERAALHVPRPHAWHVLGTATTPLRLQRIDARTLRVSPLGGFLQNPSSRLSRSELRPFAVGQDIPQGDMNVRVREITPEGRPLSVEITFARPLEDGLYVWRQWLGSGAVPFTPPPIGATVTLPAVDFGEAMFGYKLPISLRL